MQRARICWTVNRLSLCGNDLLGASWQVSFLQEPQDSRQFITARQQTEVGQIDRPAEMLVFLHSWHICQIFTFPGTLNWLSSFRGCAYVTLFLHEKGGKPSILQTLQKMRSSTKKVQREKKSTSLDMMSLKSASVWVPDSESGNEAPVGDDA